MDKNNAIYSLPWELQVEIIENKERKDYTEREKAMYQRLLKMHIKKHTQQGRRTDLHGTSVSPEAKVDRTLGIVGEAFDESPTTVYRRLKVLEAEEKEPEKFGGMLERIDKGKLSLVRAYKQVTKEDRIKKIPKLPSGEYDVLYVDPPWEYDVDLRGSANNHYQTMSLEKLKELKLPSTNNSILFLWSTLTMNEKALELMNVWGYEYKSQFVWVKPSFGTGFYVRGQHELLLIGIKGDFAPPDEEDRHSSVIQAKKGKHSEKPHSVYEIIEKMFPGRKYIEMFSRQKKQRTGWVHWGDEISE